MLLDNVRTRNQIVTQSYTIQLHPSRWLVIWPSNTLFDAGAKKSTRQIMG